MEHTYAYAHPGAADRPTAQGRITGARVGWLIAATSALALATALFPWAVLYHRADSGYGPITETEVVHGYDGLLGPPSMIFYSLGVVLGVLIAVRRGFAVVSFVSLAISAVLLVFLFLKSAAVALSADLASADSQLEPAFWLALVATTGLLASSIVALAWRPPGHARR